MHRGRVTLLAAAALVSCAPGIDPGPSPSAEAPSAVPPGPPVRGELRETADGPRFVVCGAPESSALPLSGRWSEAEVLGLPLYVEARGAPDGSMRSFHVEELVRALPRGEGMSCERPVFDGDFVINGNEPFWGIEIRRDGIVYRSPEEPKGRTYPYAATRNESGKLLYATRSDPPGTSVLEIDLTPKRCVDSMSGEIRSYEARVTLDGRELRGCAAAGVPFGEFGDDPLDELRRFTGTYETHGPLWKSEALRPRLEALLGGKLRDFEDRFQVAGPLREDQGVYYATGNMTHRGGIDSAAFLADPGTGTINVVLVEGGKRRDFREGERDVAPPADVRNFLSNLD